MGRGSAGGTNPSLACLPAAVLTPGPGSDVGMGGQPPCLTPLPRGSWRPLDRPQPTWCHGRWPAGAWSTGLWGVAGGTQAHSGGHHASSGAVCYGATLWHQEGGESGWHRHFSDKGQALTARQVAKTGRGAPRARPPPGALLKQVLTVPSPSRATPKHRSHEGPGGRCARAPAVGWPSFPWLGGVCAGSRWGGGRLEGWGQNGNRQRWTPRSGRWGCCAWEPWASGRRTGHSCTCPLGCTCAGPRSRRDTAWSPPPGEPPSPGSRCTGAP